MGTRRRNRAKRWTTKGLLDPIAGLVRAVDRMRRERLLSGPVPDSGDGDLPHVRTVPLPCGEIMARLSPVGRRAVLHSTTLSRVLEIGRASCRERVCQYV